MSSSIRQSISSREQIAAKMRSIRGEDKTDLPDFEAASSPSSLPPMESVASAQASQLAQDRKDEKSVPTPGSPVEPEMELPGARKPWWEMTTGARRAKALKAEALRSTGLSVKEVAEAMGVAVDTVHHWRQLANKNGWLEEPDAKDRLTFDLIPKALANLNAFLGSRDVEIRKEVTLETLKGTAFKAFDKAAPSEAQTAIAIKIVMPEGPAQTMREDSGGSVPAYIEGDTES